MLFPIWILFRFTFQIGWCRWDFQVECLKSFPKSLTKCLPNSKMFEIPKFVLILKFTEFMAKLLILFVDSFWLNIQLIRSITPISITLVSISLINSLLILKKSKYQIGIYSNWFWIKINHNPIVFIFHPSQSFSLNLFSATHFSIINSLNNIRI